MNTKIEVLPEQSQQRFVVLNELLKQLQISRDEMSELNALVAQIRTLNEERDAVIEQMKINQAKYKIDIAAVFGLRPKVTIESPSKKKAKKAKPKTSQHVLIIAPKQTSRGRRPTYCKGQKYPNKIPAGFQFVRDSSAPRAAIATCFTPLGADYFSTPEGEAELNSFIAYLTK